jgi:spore coat protein U-like protein
MQVSRAHLGHGRQAFALLAALGWATAAHAGADCSISTVGLNFGNYDQVASQPDDVAATVTVTCVYVPPGATSVRYTLALSGGLNGSGPADRSMASGGSRLGYGVYEDPARTQPLGTGIGGTVVASGSMTVGPGVGNGTRTATHVIYGRVPALQDVAAGTYLDTLLLTLAY